MPDLLDQAVDASGNAIAGAAKSAPGPAGQVIGGAIGGAVTGAAVGGAVAGETVVGQAIGAAIDAATSAAAASAIAAGDTAAADAIISGVATVGTAIGAAQAAIPIPVLGAAIGVIVGVATAISNYFGGHCAATSYVYIAKTPAEAKLLLAVIRIDPTQLFETVVRSFKDQAQGCFNDASFEQFFTPTNCGQNNICGNDRTLSDAQLCAKWADSLSDICIIYRELKLLAGEVKGVKFAGPVIFPSSFSRRTSNKGIEDAHDPPPDYSQVNVPGVLEYIATNINCGAPDKSDPLLDPTGIARVYKQWLNRVDPAPMVQSPAAAELLLQVLRGALPQLAPGGKPVSVAGHTIVFNQAFRDEIKAVRVFAGESGPDPILSPIIGDVTVSQPTNPLVFLGGMTAAAVLAMGLAWRAHMSRQKALAAALAPIPDKPIISRTPRTSRRLPW